MNTILYWTLIVILVGAGILLLRHIQRITYKRAIADSNQNTSARIQQLLTPANPACKEKSAADIYGILRPGQVSGGDFYDFQERDNHLYFCIGDVPGKGLYAAIYMAMVRGLFRQAIRRNTDAAEIMTLINEVLSDGNEQQMFCSIFIGVLDLHTGHLTYCNAGHQPPLRMERTLPREIAPMSDEGERQIPVGVMPDYPYRSCHTDLTTNDCLLLYTDGIIGAENKKHKAFGEERLMKVLKHTSVTHTDDICKAVLRAALEHVHGAALNDDITMLAIAPTAIFTDSRTRTLELTNSLDQIERLAEWIESLAEPYTLAPGQVFNLNLAIEEIVANIINYAYPGEIGRPIALAASPTAEGLQIVITDEGIPFDPTTHDEPDLTLNVEDRQIGGLGILLASRLTRNISYKREGNKNVLTLLC